jgi:hypothetical protein
MSNLPKSRSNSGLPLLFVVVVVVVVVVLGFERRVTPPALFCDGLF